MKCANFEKEFLGSFSVRKSFTSEIFYKPCGPYLEQIGARVVGQLLVFYDCLAYFEVDNRGVEVVNVRNGGSFVVFEHEAVGDIPFGRVYLHKAGQTIDHLLGDKAQGATSWGRPERRIWHWILNATMNQSGALLAGPWWLLHEWCHY